MEHIDCIQAMKSNLRLLIGEVCWGVIGGNGVGSRVHLLMGRKIPRDIALKNPNLTLDEREYTGEYSLFIEDASWRLRNKDQLLCTWATPHKGSGSSLVLVSGLVIKDVLFNIETLDLTLVFDGYVLLDVFCGWMDSCEDKSDNYTYSLPAGSFVADGTGKCYFDSK